ncbi:Response regulator MprA [Aquisphaera giovannonii]|uniref:Response regulator MprA n=1 Tax=Aquisphaera giovannonii TaxID=406548 RepID=A0A5B9WC52_9BACT|nr:response regulator [Aquisphaera giovannonii]QEH37625.1 Response regulator MprA [Aquisphaera giovannonii]
MKSILVVDDEFDLVGMLRSILEGEGYGTDSCSNGRAALERLKASKPDLLLMDVMLPYLSGLEVLRTMKGIPGLDGIPVVLMSSVQPGVKQRDYRWDAFLRKPFGLEDLLRTVRRFVGTPEGAGRA